MADKKKLKIIAGELRKASAMHKAQAKKIDSMSKGPSMINVAGTGGQKKSTAVGSVSPHSHDSSKDNAQPIPPITPPMPDNITGNIGNNFKVQELGKNMFQGEEMANQFAQRQMDKPVMPPSPDPMGDQYGNMFNQPFSQKKIVKRRAPEQPRLQHLNPPEKVPQKLGKVRSAANMIGGVKKPKDPNKGKAYVVNERPNVWQEGTADRSKDTLWLDNKYKKMAGSYIDQDEYDDLARTAHSEGSYKRVGVQDLEGGGEIKIKI